MDRKYMVRVCVIYIYIILSEVGGSETNREIVSFRFVRSCVRVCARSGCRVEFRLNLRSLPSPFSLLP
jgi:hypothetical protein